MTEATSGGRPPKVLICDSNHEMARKLKGELSKNSLIDQSVVASSIKEARSIIDSGDLDIIFLGLLSFDMLESSGFLFSIRRECPGIVFALYVDPASYEQAALSFDGELSRLSHYHRLDRTLDGLSLAQALQHVLGQCLMDLGISTRD